MFHTYIGDSQGCIEHVSRSVATNDAGLAIIKGPHCIDFIGRVVVGFRSHCRVCHDEFREWWGSNLTRKFKSLTSTVYFGHVMFEIGAFSPCLGLLRLTQAPTSKAMARCLRLEKEAKKVTGGNLHVHLKCTNYAMEQFFHDYVQSNDAPPYELPQCAICCCTNSTGRRDGPGYLCSFGE